MGDILPFNALCAGPGAKVHPDDILKRSVGEFDRLVLVGFKEGEPVVRCTDGLCEAVTMLETGKLHLMLERE